MEILRIMQVAPGRYQLEVVSQTTVGEALLALEQARAQVLSVPLLPEGEGKDADGCAEGD